jgi:16S rRNA (guanine527-N7)-methyltransferase
MFHVERPGPPAGEILVESTARPSLLARQGLEELGLAGPRLDALSHALGRLAELLARWSARINLTGHGNAEAVVRRLILDALAMDRMLPEVSSMVDLGSGAGFPGLPIALLHPERSVTLVDSRERSHHFQRAAVRELGIENTILRLGRAEELVPEPHALVTAQAMAAPRQAVIWMLPWAERGGTLALPLSAAQSPPEPIEGVGAESVSSYAVPLGGPRRGIWLGRKLP